MGKTPGGQERALGITKNTQRNKNINKLLGMQTSLFVNRQQNLLPCDGEVLLYPAVFSKEESDNYLVTLRREIKWKQEPIKIMGKEIMQPRLTAWYGEADKPYTYSGITMQPFAWTNSLKIIKEKIESITGTQFTSALLNLYRSGSDSMGWHRDNEKELGINPTIGSVSFGATRNFQFRKYSDKSNKITLELSHGSFLLMRGSTNHHWEHRVPKTSEPVNERINITFRIIK